MKIVASVYISTYQRHKFCSNVNNRSHTEDEEDIAIHLCCEEEFERMGETKIFTQKTHSKGLISLDCYNGKSVFQFDMMENKMDEERDDE